MSRRLLLASGGILVLLLGLGVILLVARGGRSDDRGIQPERYSERELLIPGNRLQFDSIERELLEPQPRGVAEPGQPLDPELVDDLEIDTLGELERELLRRSEEAIGEWLRD